MKNITVFTRTTCAPCQTLKRWLKHKDITYKEINIDDDIKAQDEAFQLSGYSIVPLTIVEGMDGSKRIIAGLNISAIAGAI